MEKRQPIPASVGAARVEAKANHLRPDVLLVDRAATAVAGVEVFVTHEVDEPKAARFMIPWVELEAEAVLVDPLVWRPRQEGGLRSLNCDHLRDYPEGEYYWEIEGGGGGTQMNGHYRSHEHAAFAIAKYLSRGLEKGFYYPRDVMTVTGDCAAGRYRGVWKNGKWIRPLQLVIARKPRERASSSAR